VLEARNNLSALIKKALAGEDVVITSHHQPQVRLVPVNHVPKRGSQSAFLAVMDTFPPASHSPEEIEALIEAERNGWE